MAFFDFIKIHQIKILWHFGGHPWHPNLDFDKNFDVWPKFPFLINISICTKMSFWSILKKNLKKKLIRQKFRLNGKKLTFQIKRKKLYYGKIFWKEKLKKCNLLIFIPKIFATNFPLKSFPKLFWNKSEYQSRKIK